MTASKPTAFRLAVLSIVLAATGPTPAISSRLSATPVYCGGETDKVTVQRYFTELARALHEGKPDRYFNRFVSKRLWTRSSKGRFLSFRLEDIGAVTPRRISREDWREISRRGERSLQAAGYRGCFYDAGKAWFGASRDEGFKLTGFAHDLTWK